MQYISCSFLLRQKRTKKGDPETPPAGRAGIYSPFPEGALIKLLYYCGEKQLSPDRFITGKNIFY
ncbi:MAG: hypothetical protein JST87_01850 [Bacteroidetes bacterium]|nr:hypothetical protein [Bacteroidota bacterium]